MHIHLIPATASERIYTDVLNGYQLTNPIMYRNDSVEIAVGFQLYQVESLVGRYKRHHKIYRIVPIRSTWR